MENRRVPSSENTTRFELSNPSRLGNHPKPEVNHQQTFEIPLWAANLVAVGEKIGAVADEEKERRLTVTLCLPRVDYAAVLLGLGIVRQHFNSSSPRYDEERMKSLIGHYVSFESDARTIVGFVEYCEIFKDFKVTCYKRESAAFSIVLSQNDWAKVKPTGRDFNPKRRVGNGQIRGIKEQNLSISMLSRLTGCEFSEAFLRDCGCLFTIYGNKTRIDLELSGSLFEGEEACLEKILRPKGHVEYEDSFHCSIEGHKSKMDHFNDTMVIIESGRSLSDQLAATQKLNRIILLGRNSVNYDECAAQVMETFANRRASGPESSPDLPASIRCLSFYHQ